MPVGTRNNPAPKSPSSDGSSTSAKKKGAAVRKKSKNGEGKNEQQVADSNDEVKTPEQVNSESYAKKTNVNDGEGVDDESFEYEFGGPIGSFFVILLLPLVIYALFFLCNKDYCLTFEKLFDFSLYDLERSLPSFEKLISYPAACAFVLWFLGHVILERVLPGEIVYGTTLSTGEKLAYRMSGHLQFWVTLGILFFGLVDISYLSDDTLVVNSFKGLSLDFVYHNFLGLITASVIFSFVLSVYVYIKSFSKESLLAKGGQSGNIVYDFFIGRELNPRIGNFDIKEFCELRPGLIGWLVINLGMASKQFHDTGHLSLSMVLLNAFQGFYVWDALHAEKSILSTMDITTDGFGFMLAFGDLAWVPFIYSLQARYLVDYDPYLSIHAITAIVGLQLIGYYVFRASNSEKDTFRRNPSDPSVKHLSYLETKRGTKLITSGWWGMARKINYTGDWIMTLSWCMLCGWQSPIPYFQAVYFMILLIHRAIRDDKMCYEKYGEDWVEYKRRVPYVFIPYVVPLPVYLQHD